MAQLKDLVVEGDARIVGNLYDNNPSIAYATCSTAAATAAKVVTTSNPSWNLKIGSLVIISSSYTNTATGPTLNVNGTGAKSIWYDSGTITTTNLDKAGTVNKPSMYMYDGTNYVWMGWSSDGSYTGTLATVATTGSYSDLINKPNATLTVKQNNTTLGTFSNTSSTNTTINVTVPTDVNQLTNDSGFMTSTVNSYSGVVTRTSGSTLNSSYCRQQGKVLQLVVTVTTNTSYSLADTMFVGTVSNSSLLPANYATGFGYSSSDNATITGSFSSNGDVVIRVIDGDISSGKSVTISFVYFCS